MVATTKQTPKAPLTTSLETPPAVGKPRDIGMQPSRQPRVKQSPLEKLQAIEKASSNLRRVKQPSGSREDVPFSHLMLCPEVFQCRDDRTMLTLSYRHINDLRAALVGNKGKPLDPMVVTAIGPRTYVIDGHHRYEAYLQENWQTKAVPVEWFNGTLAEAQVEAFKFNMKSKLPLGSTDKFEFAWKLVKQGELSKKQIVIDTHVGDGTVAKMRRLCEAHPAELKDVSWANAKSGKLPDHTEEELARGI